MIRRLGYNLAFLVLLALLLPWLLTRMLRRGQWRQQFGQRFGRFTPQDREALAGKHPVWLHAVSVGEANLVVRLVRALQLERPDLPLVVSTTTTTGMAELKRQLPASVTRIYYPLDLRGWVRRSLHTVQPQAIVLVEAEIWPNFLWHTHDLQIPLLLANARVSDRSSQRYRQLKSIFQPLFAGFKLVCCATEKDADRLRTIGCQPAALRAVGNLKYDLSQTDLTPQPHTQEILSLAGAGPERLVLIGGSTHAGEEKILGRIVLQLRQRFPRLYLIVAPRHFERASEAVSDLTALGLKVARRTELNRKTPAQPSPNCDALVVDTTGELKSFYARADIVFIGKSITAQGGQNLIEPAALGRAIVTGPHMQNFRRVMDDFLRHHAVIQVADEPGLAKAVESLASDPDRRQTLGQAAKQVVEAGTGALQRTVDHLLKHLPRNRRGVTETGGHP